MNIKKELQEILKQIDENTVVAHDDCGENGIDAVVLEDFEPAGDGSESTDEPVTYNSWYQRLKQLIEIL